MTRRRPARPAKAASSPDTTTPGGDPGENRPPPFLAVAHIVAPFGIKGEVRAELLTDFPDRFRNLEHLFMGNPPAPVNLERVRHSRDQLLIKIEGYDDRDAAETLRGQELWVPTSEAMPLGEDEYYVYQIEGLAVWTTQGQHLGKVTEILFTGGNDVYVVEDEQGHEILIPAIADVVKEVDLDTGRLVIELLEGLI